jgi:transposase-like protein
MSKRYAPAVKEEVLGKIRNGRKVAEVAREHGINEMTVRNWLERDTAAGASEILETSRLRRENEALLRLVGQLTYESEQQKKNQRRAGR